MFKLLLKKCINVRTVDKYKYSFKEAKFEILDNTLTFNKKESGKCWNVTGYFEKKLDNN